MGTWIDCDVAEKIEVLILGAFLSDVSAHGQAPDYEGYRRDMLRQFAENDAWLKVDERHSRAASALLERERRRRGNGSFDRRLDLIERLVDVVVTNTRELHRLQYRLEVREREEADAPTLIDGERMTKRQQEVE
jgi:hypothetical protein